VKGAVTWCRTSLWTRVFSAHRFGWYRYPVAYVIPGLIAAAGADATSIPAVVGGPLAVASAMCLLWFLPGARVGPGYGEDGIRSRRWLFVRFVPWSEVAMIELGVVNWDRGFRSGSRVGVLVLRTDGRSMDLRGLPWLARWRVPALGPLLAAAQVAGVPISIDPGAGRWFPGVPVDLEGFPRYRDGRWGVD
jgi:hypothetical protein